MTHRIKVPLADVPITTPAGARLHEIAREIGRKRGFDKPLDNELEVLLAEALDTVEGQRLAPQFRLSAVDPANGMPMTMAAGTMITPAPKLSSKPLTSTLAEMQAQFARNEAELARLAPGSTNPMPKPTPQVDQPTPNQNSNDAKTAAAKAQINAEMQSIDAQIVRLAFDYAEQQRAFNNLRVTEDSARAFVTAQSPGRELLARYNELYRQYGASFVAPVQYLTGPGSAKALEAELAALQKTDPMLESKRAGQLYAEITMIKSRTTTVGV